MTAVEKKIEITDGSSFALIRVLEITPSKTEYVIERPRVWTSSGDEIKACFKGRITDNVAEMFFELKGSPNIRGCCIYYYRSTIHGREWFLRQYPTIEDFKNEKQMSGFSKSEMTEEDEKNYPNCPFINNIAIVPDVQIIIDRII